MAAEASTSGSVTCNCPESPLGGDGLDLFDLNPQRQIKTVTEMTEKGWYSLQLDLERPGSPISLVPRVGHALVTLSQKNEIYMIGGGNNEGALTEIWKINASGTDPWEIGIDPSLSLEFPGRYEFFCGLNKNEDKIWIFGGATVCTTHNDVFYIDLEKGQVQEVSPPPLEPTVDLFDPEVKKPVVEPDPNSPLGRTQGSNSCVVEIKGEEHLIIFGGGLDKEKSVADQYLYTFNVSNSIWNKLEIPGNLPVPVQGHGIVAIGSKVYLFGGMEDMQLFDDFFVIDLEPEEVKWKKIRVNGPKPSARAAFGVTTIGKNIYVFGGVGEHGSLADLWKYDTESKEWTQINSGMRTLSDDQKRYEIQPRLDLAMTSCSVMIPKDGGGFENCDVLVVNGGMNTMGHLFEDTWIFPLFI